jgi:hypothetical protein
MLHKCANPSCCNQFRHLSEGKLFQLETEYFENGVHASNGRARSRRRVEYFWLCGECAPFLSLSFDKAHGLITVPMVDVQARKTVAEVNLDGYGQSEWLPAVRSNGS